MDIDNLPINTDKDNPEKWRPSYKSDDDSESEAVDESTMEPPNETLEAIATQLTIISTLEFLRPELYQEAWQALQNCQNQKEIDEWCLGYIKRVRDNP